MRRGALEERGPVQVSQISGTPPDVFKQVVAEIADQIAKRWDVLQDPAASIEAHATLEPQQSAHPWKITVRVETASPDHLVEMEREQQRLEGGA